MGTFFTRLPHRLTHAIFMEIVYAYAYHGHVDLRHALLRAWGGASRAPGAYGGTRLIRDEEYGII